MNSQLCLGSRRPLGDWTSRKKNTGNRRFRWTRSDLKTISFFTAGRQQVISVFHATGATGGRFKRRFELFSPGEVKS